MHTRLGLKLGLLTVLATALATLFAAQATPAIQESPPLSGAPVGHAPVPQRGMVPLALFLFRAMDSNDNGEVTKEEAAEFANKIFERDDANGDGKVSATEVIDRLLTVPAKVHAPEFE